MKLLLAGFERQTFRDFEVIIADDGSAKEVVDEINQIKDTYSFPIIHVWQVDDGWQKNKVLNRAVTRAASEFLVFVDGDCIPHSRYVEDYYKHLKKGLVLGGRRVMLDEKTSKELNEEKVKKGYLEKSFFSQLIRQWFGGLKEVQWGIHVDNPFLRFFIRYKRKGIKGCNFGVCRSDILEVNGFDERYLKPTIGEDDDLNYRLLLVGKKVKISVNRFVQYHLYHKPLSRDNKENQEIFEQVKSTQTAFTPFGIKKVL